MTKSRPLAARLMLEGAAIVGSILVAFAIDAAWDYRGELETERELLTSLSEEFRANLQALDVSAEAHRRFQSAAARMLEVSRSGEHVPAAEMDTLVNLSFLRYWTFNPSQGAREAILASGGLELIRDHQLRQRIGAWSGELEDFSEEEREMASEVARWRPALEERVALGPAYSADSSGGLSTPGAPVPDYSAIMGVLELENFLELRLDNERAILRGYERLRLSMDSTIVLIEQAMGSGNEP